MPTYCEIHKSVQFVITDTKQNKYTWHIVHGKPWEMWGLVWDLTDMWVTGWSVNIQNPEWGSYTATIIQLMKHLRLCLFQVSRWPELTHPECNVLISIVRYPWLLILVWPSRVLITWVSVTTFQHKLPKA